MCVHMCVFIRVGLRTVWTLNTPDLMALQGCFNCFGLLLQTSFNFVWLCLNGKCKISVVNSTWQWGFGDCSDSRGQSVRYAFWCISFNFLEMFFSWEFKLDFSLMTPNMCVSTRKRGSFMTLWEKWDHHALNTSLNWEAWNTYKVEHQILLSFL